VRAQREKKLPVILSVAEVLTINPSAQKVASIKALPR